MVEKFMQNRGSITINVIHPMAELRRGKAGDSKAWRGRIMSVAESHLSEGFGYATTGVISERLDTYAKGDSIAQVAVVVLSSYCCSG